MNTAEGRMTESRSSGGSHHSSGCGIHRGPFASQSHGDGIAPSCEASEVGSSGREQQHASNPQKIVIFYSSIGNGHLNAALAIQHEILKREPTTRVVLQDIRTFMHPVWRHIDERLYWFVANNLPECFDSLFRSMQARGNHVASLSSLPSSYPEEKVLAYLLLQAPDAVLATHYGSAQVLGTLRSRGLLTNVRIGWLHTDFFEGYFPRISKRIDRTFLAHAELESRWLAAGVPGDKVVTSGMPVCIPADCFQDRRSLRACLGLVPISPTLLLTSGKEGVFDYCAVVESISRHLQGPVQIIAVCGTNARQRALLTTLQDHLPPRVTLQVRGLLPQHEMMRYMRVADLLITKAGGMTPAEGFAMGIPTILLDILGGHERENAATFARLGMARLVKDVARVGNTVADCLADPRRTRAMVSAQRQFRQSANITSIAQFALDESAVPADQTPDLGIEDGTGVLDIKGALKRLNDVAPADIELLLSYANSRSPQRLVITNPFGHLAIRIGATVYSANHIAARGIDPNLLQHLSLADYLYGLHRPSRSQVHTSTYGMAYGRGTLGLRVAGVPARCITDMAAEAQRIEEEFAQEVLRYDRSDFNCGHVVTRILGAGGYRCQTQLGRLRLPVMPLDVFEQARRTFEKDRSLRTELVAYRQVPGSQASYQFSRFPLSLGQPLRSIAQILSDAPSDPLEEAVKTQVTAYFGDRRLCVESLEARYTTSGLDDPALSGQTHPGLEKAIVADLRRLLALNARGLLANIKRLHNFQARQEIRRFINRGHELARLATERAEEILLGSSAERLRSLYTRLAADYGRISREGLRARRVKAYFELLNVFGTTASEEFAQLDKPRIGSSSRRTCREAQRRGK